MGGEGCGAPSGGGDDGGKQSGGGGGGGGDGGDLAPGGAAAPPPGVPWPELEDEEAIYFGSRLVALGHVAGSVEAWQHAGVTVDFSVAALEVTRARRATVHGGGFSDIVIPAIPARELSWASHGADGGDAVGAGGENGGGGALPELLQRPLLKARLAAWHGLPAAVYTTCRVLPASA